MIDYIIISFTFHGITLANYSQSITARSSVEPSAFCVVFIAKWGPSEYRLLARWESTITDAYCFAAFRLLCALLSILLRGIIIRPQVYGTATVLDQSLHSKQIDSLRLEPRATAFSHILCCGHLPLHPELPYTSLYFSPPAQLCHH